MMLPARYQPIWTSFWSQPQTAAPLAFFRIGVGLLTLVHTAVLYHESEFLDVYGQYGLIRGELNEALLMPDFPRLSWITNSLRFAGIDEVTALKAILLFYSGALLNLALGFQTRVSGFLAWGINLMMINSSLLFSYGYDTFTNNALLYCWLLPVGHSFAIDTGWRQHNTTVSREATLGRRVLQLHLCIVYVFSGIHKTLGEQWWTGEAIWRAVMQPPFNTHNAAWLANWPVVSLLLGWGTLALEAGYPLWVFPSKWRAYGLAAIISMHVGIGFFMGLWFFAFIMIIWNLTAFGIRSAPKRSSIHASSARVQTEYAQEQEIIVNV
jgi:hypothetical protein